jgi:hypothetical protein
VVSYSAICPFCDARHGPPSPDWTLEVRGCPTCTSYGLRVTVDNHGEPRFATPRSGVYRRAREAELARNEDDERFDF